MLLSEFSSIADTAAPVTTYVHMYIYTYVHVCVCVCVCVCVYIYMYMCMYRCLWLVNHTAWACTRTWYTPSLIYVFSHNLPATRTDIIGEKSAYIRSLLPL
jgi:hypothetical protein